MQIAPIRFSNTIPLNKNQITQDNKKDNIFQKNIVSFPKAYGATNIAFCGKKTKKGKRNNTDKPGSVNIKLEEMLSLYRKRESETGPDVPVFSPYNKHVTEALTYLCSNEPCFVFHSENLDSKELFVNGLRFGIDSENSKIRRYGFNRGIPFIHIDMADYVENPMDAIAIIEKEAKSQAKSAKKAIIIADNAESLLSVTDRPFDFVNASVFKKYPTIFLTEDRFRTFSQEDEDLYKSSMLPYKKRDGEYDELDYNSEEAKKVISRRKIMESSNIVFLPNVTRNDVKLYLSNPLVQKYLIGQGQDTEFDLGTLDYTLDLARALSHDKENYFGTQFENRILNDKTEALDMAIKMLRKGAVASKIAGEPCVRMEDVSDILPEGTQTISILKNFLSLQETVDALWEMDKKEKSVDVINSDTPEETPDKKDKTTKEIAGSGSVSKNSKFEVIKDPKTKFSDVGGMYNVKRQLKEQLLDILNNPNVANSKKPNGILLYGPPGSGKTLLASAIAGEAGVPFISTSGSSFVEIYVGTGPKAVREIYEQARKEASEHPSKTAIVFIDEAESATRDRGEKYSSSEDLKTVNAILHEMDGASNKSENDIKVITILATNHEGAIDSAVKRSGRIGLSFIIDDPRYTESARREIANIHAKDLTFKNNEEKERLLNLLAHNTMGMTGADIAQILKNAYLMSLRIGHPEYVTQEDLRQAKLQLIAGVKSDIESTNYEVLQALDHEFGHAVSSMILEKIYEGEENKHKMPLKVLDFITSEARGNKLGATYFKPSYDNRTMSKETFMSDLIMLYGGSAAETKMFTTHSARVKDDYTLAGEALLKAITEYDFGSKKHYMALTSDYAKSIWSGEIKDEMDNFAQKCMSISKKMISFAQPFIEEYLHSTLSESNNNEERIINADQFKTKFNEWLKKSGKQDEYKALCKEIKSEIEEFCIEDKERNKLGF